MQFRGVEVQEVVSSIVGCYCARVQRTAAAEVQAELDNDTIFQAMADAMTTGAAVQVQELMTETGMHSLNCLTTRWLSNKPSSGIVPSGIMCVREALLSH